MFAGEGIPFTKALFKQVCPYNRARLHKRILPLYGQQQCTCRSDQPNLDCDLPKAEQRKQFLGHWKNPVCQYYGTLKGHMKQDNEPGLKIGPQIAPYDPLKSVSLHVMLRATMDGQRLRASNNVRARARQ
eukprot:1234426-Amphidinium_carterae.1